MNSSKTNCRLSLLAMLLTAALFAGSSVGGEHLEGATRAPINPAGTTSILQADGIRPVPPPPPTQQISTAPSQS